MNVRSLHFAQPCPWHGRLALEHTGEDARWHRHALVEQCEEHVSGAEAPEVRVAGDVRPGARRRAAQIGVGGQLAKVHAQARAPPARGADVGEVARRELAVVERRVEDRQAMFPLHPAGPGRQRDTKMYFVNG